MLSFKAQPTLDELAEKVNLIPFHFLRMFTQLAATENL
ncbi:MAG: AraC family transcriptional regulator of adaptative response [Roseivirga sp.]|jgi:AraC family transcriptional regulator of adaptative response/methylated-DNA-[protein]-cysteine methyltransferase